jgi:PKD repeat protein
MPLCIVMYRSVEEKSMRSYVKPVLLIAAAGILLCPCGVRAQDSPFLRGDVNASGELDIADAISLMQYLFADHYLGCVAAADFSDDGEVLLSDAVALLGFLLHSEAPPPPPFPTCGPDPTPDNLGCAVFEVCEKAIRVSFEATPDLGDAPLDVIFDASASRVPGGTIAAFTWDFGDGTRATGVVVEHTYQVVGTYRATLTVSAEDGAEAASTRTITVEDPWAPRIVSFGWVRVDDRVTLAWRLTAPGDEIRIFRGSSLLATGSGDAVSFTSYESDPGCFLYTVALYRGGECIRQKRALVDRGRLVWDPPPESVSGYYIYVSEVPRPLPWNDGYGLDAASRTSVPLKELYDAGVLTHTAFYTFAVSSYRSGRISEQCDSIDCEYKVVVEPPEL